MARRNTALRYANSIFVGTVLSLSLCVATAAAEQKSEDAVRNELISRLASHDANDVQSALAYIRLHKPADVPARLAETIVAAGDINLKKISLVALQEYPVKKNIPLWIDILGRSRSFVIKKEVIEVLAKTSDKAIVPGLANELSNPFYSVRESAIRGLKNLDDDRMFGRIVNMARDGQPIYRVYALQAMYSLYDSRFFNLVQDLLRDENKSVRYAALKCVARNSLSKSIGQIRTMAQKDDNYEVRVKAIEILGELKDSGSLYLLQQSLSATEREIRYAAALSLKLLREQRSAHALSGQLAIESDNAIKELIMDSLAELRNGGGLAGLQKVLLHDATIRMRVLAAYTLGTVRETRAVPILIQGCEDADQRVRAEACHGLGNYRDKAAITRLLATIEKDQGQFVRTAALYAIKRINEKNTAVPLFDIFAIEKDPLFRELLRTYIRELMKRHI